jgi:hypothetical protein
MPVHGGRSGDDVRAGALERGGPRRGGVEPSSEAKTLLVGAFNPRARRTSPEEASAVPPSRAVGATWVVIMSCVCFRFVG